MAFRPVRNSRKKSPKVDTLALRKTYAHEIIATAHDKAGQVVQYIVGLRPVGNGTEMPAGYRVVLDPPAALVLALFEYQTAQASRKPPDFRPVDFPSSYVPLTTEVT